MAQVSQLKEVAANIVNDLHSVFETEEVYVILSLASAIALTDNIVVEEVVELFGHEQNG